jgi:hypothetical protein
MFYHPEFLGIFAISDPCSKQSLACHYKYGHPWCHVSTFAHFPCVDGFPFVALSEGLLLTCFEGFSLIVASITKGIFLILYR